ncbi:hypothetical protein D3C87_1070380 [compost metagenome]
MDEIRDDWYMTSNLYLVSMMYISNFVNNKNLYLNKIKEMKRFISKLISCFGRDNRPIRRDIIDVIDTREFVEVPLHSRCLIDVLKDYEGRRTRRNLRFVKEPEYSNSQKSSSDAIDYMDYIAKTQTVLIRRGKEPTGTKRSKGRPEVIGELKIVYIDVDTKKKRTVFMDGFCEETKTFYEYNGEHWHGSYDNLLNGTLDERNIKTRQKEDDIKDLYNISREVSILEDGSIRFGTIGEYMLVCMWESKWLQYKKLHKL